ncbi:hypothetical protein [Oricola sp.]|uniref:hypothetical protein n=1 Tax=Oricola sp. TaxID=1979950 RepID=UPI003BA8C887
MIAGIDAFTLVIIGLFITAAAYFIASAMHGVMGPDGFGTIPNMVILLTGGFLATYLMEVLRIPLRDPTGQAVTAITGGFCALALLATLKAVASRLGY